jgi:hypothetical protein
LKISVMIRSRHFIIPVLALCLVACAKESREAGGLVKHTITAGIEGATKVQIIPDPADENKSKVLWSAGEVVDVWVGETAYEFTGQNASAALSTTFRGTAPADLGKWVLVYPQGASTGKSGNVITATLPAVQNAVAGSFDTDAALIAGLGTGASVTCKHLYSGIRFKLTETGIKTISLRGNNGEKIAGTFSFDISGESPVITGGSSETIVLNAPGGGTFIQETWYYILCLPTTFSKGVTITADKGGSSVGYVTTDGSVVFQRKELKSRASLTFDKDNWKTIGTTGTVYYGPANTICLKPNESATIDVAPYLTTAKWQRSGIPAEAVLPESVEMLWGSPFASLSISPDRKTITITGASEGRSLIAIKNGETILWSYLIWVKSSFSETTLPNGKKLLPSLGDNCYFQWGRKDPLLSDASQLGNENHGLENSIQHPSHFIKGAENAWDWFCDGYLSNQDATLWGGDSCRKTVWDPCPQGYRVPSEEEIVDLTSEPVPVSFYTSENGFQELGILGRNSQESTVYFAPNNRSYWTRDVLAYGYASGLVITYNETDPDTIAFDGFVRDQGLPLRCVME